MAPAAPCDAMLQVTTPQITWHGGENGKNDPVLSADVHPCGVLATSGADADIRVWKLHLEEDKEEKDFQDFLYNLEGHEKSVNVVRFSPSGRVLASASDGGTIILHRLPDDRPLRTWCFASKAKKVVEMRVLRTTQEDVYDLCWSPSSHEIVSASVDHKVFVWNAVTGKHITFFDDHSNYVQGVCWDPREKYLASESNDRSCRIYARKMNNKGRKKKKDKAPAATAAAPQGEEAAADGAATGTAPTTATTTATPSTTNTSSTATATTSSKKSELAFSLHCTLRQLQRPAEDKPAAAPVEETAATATEPAPTTTEAGAAKSMEPIEVNDESSDVMIVERVAAPAPPAPAPTKRAPRLHLFADETVPTFFRRASWSPDGCLLVTPTGIRRDTLQAKQEFVTHVWARDHFDKPVMQLPCGKKASVAVRFCPQLFKLRETKEPTKHLTNLPYRMVYAVLTVNAVLVYDTQHFYPIAMVSNTHLASLTDAAWLPDGSALVATSMDGYVTVLAFPDRELGEPIEATNVPPVVRKLHLPIYEQKERDAEDEELDRLEEKERAELAAAKAQAAIERQQQLEAKKAAEEERRRKLQLLKEQQKQEQKAQATGDSDDEDEVIIVERPKRKEPAPESAKPQGKGGDDEESLKLKDSDESSSEDEQELEDDDDDDDDDDDEKEAYLRRVRALEDDDNGLATESEDEDEDDESDKEDDKMEEDDKESGDEEELDAPDKKEKQEGKEPPMAKKAEAKAEASRPAEEEKVSPRKRKSEDVQPEQGAGGKGTTGDDGKDVAKKPKRIAPTLVQPLAPADTSNSSAPPTPRPSATTTTPAAASTTPTGQGDSASRPKKRVAPTLISGPSA